MTYIHEVIRRIRPLAPIHKAAHLRGLIASEKGENKYRTSVRIRELEAALREIMNKQLKRESRAA